MWKLVTQIQTKYSKLVLLAFKVRKQKHFFKIDIHKEKFTVPSYTNFYCMIGNGLEPVNIDLLNIQNNKNKSSSRLHF